MRRMPVRLEQSIAVLLVVFILVAWIAAIV
jgi:hypothetical protein